VFTCFLAFRSGASAQRLAKRYPWRGFTLVELLVVIVIVGILIALVMPSITKARDSAQSVKCMSNLRQIWVMTETYCTDNGNILPPSYGWTSGGSVWLEYLVAQVKGISIYDARDAIARGEVPSHCPIVLPSDKDITLKSPSGASYWINYGVNFNNLGQFQTTNGLPNFSRLKVSLPSKCIYLADAPGALLNPYGPPAWQAAARHHGRSNVLWMDGHVTSELTSWLNNPSTADYIENWWSTR